MRKHDAIVAAAKEQEARSGKVPPKVATARARRLSAAHVKQLREIVQGSIVRARRELLKARRSTPRTQEEDAEVTFYENIITRNEALLTALPERGSVELEEDDEDEEDEEDEDDETADA